MVCACEDVGLAYPQIIPIVKAACDIAMQVGLPEARLPLADAVILVATSPKFQTTAHNAINEAMADLKAGRSGPIPRTLQNKHFDGEDQKVKGQFYLYPHDFPNRWVEQQYLPDALKDRVYYHPPPIIRMNRQLLPTGKRSKAKADPGQGLTLKFPERNMI